MMEQARDTLVIRIVRTPGRLGMSAFYNCKSEGAVPYKEIPADETKISALCEKISGILIDTNGDPGTQSRFLPALRETGRQLFETVFIDEIKERIRKAGVEYLVFSFDDSLMGLPWELLHDGKEFLCLRFAVSRSVGHLEFTGVEYREAKKKLKALVLAPASPGLGMTYNEGVYVVNRLYASDGRIETSLQVMEVEAAFVREKMSGFDIVHFVGHIDYDLRKSSRSGWVFNDGIFSAQDARVPAGTGHFPSFVFSDACQRGEKGGWSLKSPCLKEASVPAAAFLSSGTKHYIETFWKIPDEARLHFVKEFYGLVIAGERIGEALRLARSRLIEKYSAFPLYWAAWTFYGDPAMTLFEERTAASSVGRGPERRRSSLFGRRLSDKIKTALLIVAICVTTLATDRVVRLARTMSEKDRMSEEAGTGLKYLASLKQEKEDAASGFYGAPEVFGYAEVSNVFNWMRVAFNIYRVTQEAWPAGYAAPILRKSDSDRKAMLYVGIFSLEQKIYLDALAGSSIRSYPGYGDPAAGRPRIKDRRVRKYFSRAKIKFAKGEYAPALKYAQKAHDMAWMMDDRRDESAVLVLLYQVHSALKQEKEALGCLLQDKAIAEKSGDAAWQADACFNLALAYWLGQKTGDTAANSFKNLEQALKIYGRIGDGGGIVRSRLMLGYAYARKREHAMALASIDRGLNVAVKSADAAAQGLLYKAYGDIYCANRKYAAAQVYYGEAIIINRPAGTKSNSLAYLDTLYRMAFLNLASRNYERGLDYYRRITAYSRDGKNAGLDRRYKNIFSCLDILIGRKDDHSVQVMRKVYLNMAHSYFKLRDFKTAEYCLDRALE